MSERIFFNRLVTKNLTATDSDRRYFEGYLTVQIVDKQNEITICCGLPGTGKTYLSCAQALKLLKTKHPNKYK